MALFNYQFQRHLLPHYPENMTHDQTIKFAEKEIEENPGFAGEMYYWLGRVYEDADRFAEARFIYEKSLSLTENKTLRGIICEAIADTYLCQGEKNEDN